jgi:hypothetical protein
MVSGERRMFRKLDILVKLSYSYRRSNQPVWLPEFDEFGMLPAGDYELSLQQLASSMLVVGPQNRAAYPHWDAAWRAQLVANLAILVGQLWQIDITEVFVDGSFAEDKQHPNDIDGYFVCDRHQLASGQLQAELNRLDPHKCWTWDPARRRAYRRYPKKQLPMWHAYRVELYPHYGQSSGIRDIYGNELEFPAAFRRSRRDGRSRGIVKIGGKA